jgi:malonate-semialdehyde dehydrogenase (acetylating)/methylmalonate-semialdehyde dehydrogenase
MQIKIDVEKPELLKNFIGGQWVNAKSDKKEPVVNPATEEILAYVPISSKEDVDQAVQAAAEAFKTWSNTDVPKRARVLFKFQQLLLEHQEELAKLVTLENGKNINESYGEVLRGIECVEFAAGAPTHMMGENLSAIATNVESAKYRYPVGVVGGIVPFNFPMMVPFWMFPLAIACGNTFVLKPSERTPITSMRVAELFAEAGLPKGAFNIVHGAHDAVNGILEHPGIHAVSFVGSQPVAEHVYKTSANHGKRVQALAGAKNHHIVMEDTNIDKAVAQVIASAFGSAGERCMACSVAVVIEEIAGKFIDKLLVESDKIKMGNGLEPGVFLGPLIRESHKEKVLQYVKGAEAEGATLIRDGRIDAQKHPKGYFLGPTIFDNVQPRMTIAQEEVFAPVLSIIRVKDLDEALAVSNASRFGNSAVIYTNNARYIQKFRDEVQSGMLGVNVGIPAPMAFYPFSGWKESFYGDLHCNGKDGIEFYTRRKMITSRYF